MTPPPTPAALHFFFEGSTPSKKNKKRIGRLPGGRPVLFSSREHKAWHARALWELKAQKNKMDGGKFPVAKALCCNLKIFYGDQRRHDNSNLWESVADLLVDAGILADDAWQVTGTTIQEPEFRKGKPGWSLTIIPLE